jgi:hypothetical protein
MNDQFHELLQESEPPFTIQTKGGRSYRVENRGQIWIPDAYRDIICLAIPSQGLMFVRFGSIESVQTEHAT